MAKKKIKGGGSGGQTASMGLITVQLESGVDEGLKDVKKVFNELSKSGTKWADNLKKYVLQGEKSFHRMYDEMYKKEKEIKELRVKLGKKELDDAGKARLKQLSQERKASLDNMRAVAKKRAELHKEAMEYSKKEYAQKIADTAKATENALEKIKGMDASIFSDFGGYLQKRGAQLEKMSLKQGGKGRVGKGMMGLGSGLVKGGIIGAALIGLGKVLVDLTDKFARMNKEISESGLNVGALATAGYDVATAFKTIRESFFLGEGTLAFNNMWGTKPEEHYKILGSFEQAGYDIREMVHGIREGADQMERFRQISVTAMTYGKLAFGSNEEAASSLAEVMDDFGYSLEGAAHQMAGLYEEAVRSGFGTKRFFSTVLQATSGMSMYNVRLQETAGLLGKLARFGSTKIAGDLLSDTLNRVTGMGYEDRVKYGMILGERQVTEVMSKALDSALGAFYQTFQSDESAFSLLQSYMSKFGDISTQDGFSKAFRKMSAKDRRELTSAIQEINPQLGTQWQVISQLLEANKSGALGKMLNLDLLDPGSAFGLVNRFSRAFGQKDLDQIGAGDFELKSLLEQVFGVSPEMLRKYQGQFASMRGGYDRISSFARDGKLPDPHMLKMWARQFGVTIKDGKVVNATLSERGEIIAGDREIKSFQDFIEAVGVTRSDLAEVKDENIALAEEIAHNTKTLSDTLDNTVTWWLSEIAESVGILADDVLGRSTKPLSKDASQKWEAFLEGLKAQRKQTIELLGAAEAELQQARAAYRKSPSAETEDALKSALYVVAAIRESIGKQTEAYQKQRGIYRKRALRGASKQDLEADEGGIFSRVLEPDGMGGYRFRMGSQTLDSYKESNRTVNMWHSVARMREEQQGASGNSLEVRIRSYLRSLSKTGAVDPQVQEDFIRRYKEGKLLPKEKESLDNFMNNRGYMDWDLLFKGFKGPTDGKAPQDSRRGNTTIINITSSSTDEIIAQIQKVVSASASGTGGP